MRIDRDANGHPVLLEDSAQAGLVKPEAEETLPGRASADWDRRHDAVREAAREFEVFSIQDVTEWLRGKTKRDLLDPEIQRFAADVRIQQMDDLVDVLDHRGRGLKRKRRFVRVVAPKGYTRKTLGSLAVDEMQFLVARLQARGWTKAQLKSFVETLPEDRRPDIDKVESEGLSFSVLAASSKNGDEIYIRTLAESIAQALPAPQIHVENPALSQPQVSVQPQINVPRVTKLEVVRGDDGLLESVQPHYD